MINSLEGFIPRQQEALWWQVFELGLKPTKLEFFKKYFFQHIP
jgi:hypothetical protein